MKKKTPPYAFIGAAILALVCIFAFFRYEKNQNDQRETAIEQQKALDAQALADANAKRVTVQEVRTDVRPVLYATQPVEAGTRISPAFFESKQTPKDILPDAFTDADSKDIIGQYAIRPIEKGDPLTNRNIGKTLPYLSQRIPLGMRAISLPIFNAEVNNTGGFVVDGDRVDLLYTVGNDKFKLNTQTVMQNVTVLYVPGPKITTNETEGLSPVPPPGDTMAVTFEVTPEQAEALVFLSNASNAHFSMILRARKDTTEPRIKAFAVEDYDMLNLNKVQKTIDKSVERVKALEAEVDAKEKAEAAHGTTNETNTPTPATP